MGKLAITIEGKKFEVSLEGLPGQGGALRVEIDGKTIPVVVPRGEIPFEEIEWVIVDGRPYEIVFERDLAWIRAFGGRHVVEIRDLEARVVRPPSGDPRVKAPIPGLIAAVLVEPGQKVETGEPVVVLEAMKMENEIHATASGTVRQVRVVPGQTVLRGEVLIEIS